MQNKICPTCNTPNPSDYSYCTNCAQKFNPFPRSAVIAISALSTIIVFMVGMFAFCGNPKQVANTSSANKTPYTFASPAPTPEWTPNTASSSPSAKSPRAQPTMKTAPSEPPIVDLKIKGNRNSMIYHLPGCRSYDRIKDENIIWFKTTEAAEKAGFRMAKNC